MVIYNFTEQAVPIIRQPAKWEVSKGTGKQEVEAEEPKRQDLNAKILGTNLTQPFLILQKMSQRDNFLHLQPASLMSQISPPGKLVGLLLKPTQEQTILNWINKRQLVFMKKRRDTNIKLRLGLLAKVAQEKLPSPYKFLLTSQKSIHFNNTCFQN